MRVIVTRPREASAELARRIEARGYEVVVCPLIEIEPLGDDPVDVDGYDWVVVTSVNGARELVRRMRGHPARVAAIGPATARALREAGIEPGLVPAVSTQEGLLAELPDQPGRVLFAGAASARRFLVDRLHADFVPLYETRLLRPRRFPDGDLVVLASPSAARAFAALCVPLPAISIGPETTAAARAAGVPVAAEAARSDVDGLVDAVDEAASAPSSA